MTLFTRTALQFVSSFFTVGLAAFATRMGMYPKAGIGKILAECGIVSTNLLITIPICFATVPQMVHVSKLEENLKNDEGFYFNRGL